MIGVRSRLAPVRGELADRGARLAHAVRHARAGGVAERASVFNLDLHIAVIADVGAALASRAIPLVDWTISGHAWVFGRRRTPVAVVNERTYLDFDARMVERFQRVYGAYLRSFRGYVATHTPCFSLLYRGLPAPTLAICSTRYEWPFTFKPDLWAWLNEELRAGVDGGWLQLAANNRADADYVQNYLGIAPRLIPSACSYVAPTYVGRRPQVLVHAKSHELAASICAGLGTDAVPLRAALGKRYSWSELYEYRALVLIPFNVSFMSLFEHYSACAPIYVPTREFLKHLMREHPQEVLFQLSYGQGSGLPVRAPGSDALDLNDLRDEQVVDWYLDRADFYDASLMPRIRQFESWAHLDHLLATDDQLAISAEMAAEKPARLKRIAESWDDLEWLRRVVDAEV